MNIEVITPPPVEPVTVLEAFFHLKITADPEYDVATDPLFAEVSRQIQSAREDCEAIARRSFVQQTLLMTRGSSTARAPHMWSGRPWGDIELLRPPVIEVTAVRYYDDDNTLVEVADDSYYVIAGLVPALRFVDGFDWPSTYIRPDALQVEYVAGYAPVPAGPGGTPPIDYRANVPASFKAAILIGVQLQSDRLLPAEREALERAQDNLLTRSRVVTL